MNHAPESTPHLSNARTYLARLLTELRQARLAREADPTLLAAHYQAGLRLDAALEEVEVR